MTAERDHNSRGDEPCAEQHAQPMAVLSRICISQPVRRDSEQNFVQPAPGGPAPAW